MIEIFHKEEEHQISVARGEEIIKTKEAVMMENQAHTVEYTRWIITIQIIVSSNAKRAHDGFII